MATNSDLDASRAANPDSVAPDATTPGARAAEGVEIGLGRADRLVSEWAAAHHAVIDSRRLRELGLDKHAVARRVKRGWMTRKHRGVYRLGPVDAPLTRQAAALLACGRGAALSHQSSGELDGLRHAGAGPVHVTVPGRVVELAGIRGHTTQAWAPGDVHVVDGLARTTARRTLLDLAAVLPALELARAVEEAQIRGLVRSEELAAAARRRGVAALRAAVAEDPALTRSEAERRMLALVRAADLPRPIVNARIGRYEVDFLWPRCRLIAEVDGYRYHSSRAAFERDRARDVELQAAGYRVLRFTWRQIVHEAHAVVARLAVALA